LPQCDDPRYRVLSLLPGYKPLDVILDPNTLEPRLPPSGMDSRNMKKINAVIHRKCRNLPGLVRLILELKVAEKGRVCSR